MEDRNKHIGNVRAAVSHERRDFLKAGVAMAAAPFIAGLASTALPSKAQAEGNNAMHKKILILSASPREDSNSDALEVERANQQLGLVIDENTCLTDWDGGRADYNYIVGGLM